MAGQKALRQFDVPKAVAAISYLVEETSETLYPVMKMLYLADKRHLQEFGRFIAGDSYCAMKNGPVPSCSYDMMKRVKERKACGDELDVALQHFEYLEGHHIKLKERPDLDELSQSELDCLRVVAETYRNLGKWAVREMTHDGAWKRAWESRSEASRSGGFIDAVSIASTLDSSELLISHIKDRHRGEAKLQQR
ncbi:Panacea domain-containing protein [Xanthomonas oryzae]|uniref:Panacea domain-containing protein n=1 Tax=Xanthomonas oryzae TaxID=347 RepID=UPI00030A3754|nr:Panacea domain-containing protein [Xanthomonas oryzae]